MFRSTIWAVLLVLSTTAIVSGISAFSQREIAQIDTEQTVGLHGDLWHALQDEWWLNATSVASEVFLLPGLVNALKVGDSATLLSLLSTRYNYSAKKHQLDDWILIDAKGRTIVSLAEPGAPQSMEPMTVAGKAIDGFTVTERTLSPQGALQLVVPAFDHSNQTAGWLVLESRPERLIERFRNLLDKPVVLRSANGVIYSSREEDKSLFAELRHRASDNRLQLHGRRYRVYSVPAGLGSTICVAYDVSQAHAAMAWNRYRAFGIGGILVLLLIWSGLVYIRRCLRPIQDLAAVMNDSERTTAGSLIVEVKGVGEIATLAHAFNSMGQHIRHNLRSLENEIEVRKSAETKVRSAMAEVNEANKSKSEFLATMSHELRTPMNGVIGMTGLLLDTDLDEDQRRYSEIVLASGESLLALINDILDFSKIEAGKLELESIDFDLSAELGAFAAVAALKAQDKGLEFILTIAPEIPLLLQGDPGRLRQVLSNLTANAAKFTEEGEIVVRVALSSETENEAVIRFSVRDTGIGIPKDKQENLFAQFTQVDASTTRKYGGTGLGLAISKQLSEAMGGEMGIHSEEAEGSDFWFTAKFSKQSNQKPEPSLPADLKGAHVLVIDDNSTNREILSLQLRAWGLRPDEADSGESALDVMREATGAGDPYVIAIVDMQMPGMDGARLGEAIREDPRLVSTRLVMMTSLARRGDRRAMEKIGFAAYLEKPVRQSDLFDCLGKVLGENTKNESPPILRSHAFREMSFGEKRILVAEDNVVNQLVAVGILEKLGLSVDVVPNGAEAVKALSSISYDLVLMDCLMPEMDGFEATAAIRNPQTDVLNHDIPIVAMTANAMKGDREKCLESGMNDYISKPIDVRILGEILENWLCEERAESRSFEGSSLPSQTPSEDSSLFDRSGALTQLGGDEIMLGLVIEAFLDDAPNLLGLLTDALGLANDGDFERHSHSLKGAAAAVGALGLRELGARMQEIGSSGELSQAAELLEDAKVQFDAFRILAEK